MSTKLFFLRRKGFSKLSTEKLCELIGGEHPSVRVLRNTPLRIRQVAQDSVLFRWGCTSSIRSTPLKEVNTRQAISLAANKSLFRQKLYESFTESGELPGIQALRCTRSAVPTTTRSLSHHFVTGQRMVLRPSSHAQGHGTFLLNSTEEVGPTLTENSRLFSNGWYLSPYIEKVAEHRVFILCGKVYLFVNKVPDDPAAVAWNTHNGGHFENVRFSEWNINSCRAALFAYRVSGLDFAAVDVMVDEDGTAYPLEVNTAPHLPPLENGEFSYNQHKTAGAILYHMEHGWGHMETEQENTWKDLIHPATWSPSQET